MVRSLAARLLAVTMSLSALPSLVGCESEPASPRELDLELIGINGRRLDDGDVYRVPLDGARPTPLEVTTREALVIVNRGPRAVMIDGLSLSGSAEWRLLAPTSARELAFDARPRPLAPGEHLDLDIALRPAAVGSHEAWLELRWHGAGLAPARRQVRFTAEVRAGGPAPPDAPQGSSR